jgi:hypothetical protein
VLFELFEEADEKAEMVFESTSVLRVLASV